MNTLAAEYLEPPEIETMMPEPAPARLALTVRTPDEILAQPQDPNDNILGDRLLAKGQSMTLLGPGGIGKSRMLLQWAAASTAGKPFLGLETHGQGLSWLVLQVEKRKPEAARRS